MSSITQNPNHVAVPASSKQLSHEYFENEPRSDNDISKVGRFVRREMAPFLPYVEKSWRQQNPPPHKKLPDNESPTSNIIKNWIKICVDTHQSHCSSSSGDNSYSMPGPRWFIDVKNQCLVTALLGAKYVALSYVWGRETSSLSCSTILNIDDLQVHGSLSTAKVQIPRTIVQVMELTIELGLQFLWVDKFCIIQDDPAPTKQDQFDAMAGIYAGAYLTIIAANGDNAESGLSWSQRRPTITLSSVLSLLVPKRLNSNRSRLSTRIQPQDVEDWSHGQVMEWYSLRLLDTKWASRGWTMQEHLFSRRKVVFQNNTVNWECHCVCWQEGQGLLDGTGAGPCYLEMSKSLVNLSNIPDMYRYARLISRYNQRDLTFPEDAIDAFAGALSDLGHVFAGGFISGLPVFCFDAALLWQPWAHMPRRSNRSSQTTNVLPSWSWVGWKGDVNSESLRAAYGYLRANVDEFAAGDWFPTSLHNYATVNWYHSSVLNGEKMPIDRLLPIGTVDHAQKQDYIPPAGWSKLKCKRSSKNFYRIGSTGDGCWYPVPIVDSHQQPSPVNRSRFIHCRTRRAFLRIASAFGHFHSACMAVELTKFGSEEAIGVLRLNQNWDFGRSLDNVPQGMCEIIELSAGSVENQVTEQVSFDEWRKDWRPKTGIYAFYNVMWIERDNRGVCFRKAVGRALKSAWDKLEKEEIDITIG